jgi:hypothetical protein
VHLRLLLLKIFVGLLVAFILEAKTTKDNNKTKREPMREYLVICRDGAMGVCLVARGLTMFG